MIGDKKEQSATGKKNKTTMVHKQMTALSS